MLSIDRIIYNIFIITMEFFENSVSCALKLPFAHSWSELRHRRNFVERIKSNS